MAYDQHLAERISRVLKDKKVSFTEKKMFGGLCYMVNDKMCVGIIKDDLMCRIHPDVYGPSLQKPGCEKMMFTGREMKGYVQVKPEAIDTDDELAYWVQLCLNFNPLAKSSKK